MTTEIKRDELREKIENAEARQQARDNGTLADRARDAAETATDFVKAHPIATVFGGIAAGLLIGSMFKGGRRVGKQMGMRAGGMASSAGRVGMSFVRDAVIATGAAALTGRDKLEDLGDSAADTARGLRRSTGFKVGTTADAARSLSRKASRTATRAVRDVRNRLPK